MNNLVEIKQLTKKYYNKVAIENIDLSIEKGKIYGLLGPNGSGKTTLMKVIAGLHKKNGGDVKVKNNDITHHTKEHVVFMPTENHLYKWMKVKTIINYYQDMYKDFDSVKALALAKEMDLDYSKKISQLSTGLASRLKVILALCRDAEILMFDEPLNGLDPISREKVLELLTSTFSHDKTIIISSHLVSEFEYSLDNVIFIKDGYIELQGNAEAIREEKGMSILDLYKEVYQ